jgi:hypothetical protein
MNTLMHSELPMTSGHALDSHPVRTVLRSAGVLMAALGLTTGVLVALATVVDTWA